MKKVIAIIGVVIFLAGISGAWQSGQEFIKRQLEATGISRDAGFLPILLLEGKTSAGTELAPTLDSIEISDDLESDIHIKSNPGDEEDEIVHPGKDQQAVPYQEIIPPAPPIRIVIPKIELDASVVTATKKMVIVDSIQYEEWIAPDQFAGGWHSDSAMLGEIGNTVINGHHNVYGEVFRDLVNLEMGDAIQVFSSEQIYSYEVTNIMVLPERWQSLEHRLQNALWIARSLDERLTLITCWPYESNTHRLIIVARPVGKPVTIPDLELIPKK